MKSVEQIFQDHHDEFSKSPHPFGGEVLSKKRVLQAMEEYGKELKDALQIARTQKINIQKEHDILLDELRKAGLRKDPFITDYSRNA